MGGVLTALINGIVKIAVTLLILGALLVGGAYLLGYSLMQNPEFLKKSSHRIEVPASGLSRNEGVSGGDASDLAAKIAAKVDAMSPSERLDRATRLRDIERYRTLTTAEGAESLALTFKIMGDVK